MEPHEQGNADGHVCIPTEVGIHLEAVGVQADEVFKSTVTAWIGEHPVDDIDREVIGQPDFFDQPVEDPKQPRSKLKSAEVIGLMKLRDEGLGAYDRPRDELREKTDEKSEVQDAAHGLDFLAVDVDGVGHGLERVERNAHRQEDLVHAECRSQVFIGPLTKRGMRLTPVRAEQRLQRVRDEVRVLEVQQNAQVDGQTRCEPAFALRTLRAIHAPANPPVRQRRKNEDGHKCATCLPVEKQARQEQVGIAHPHAFFGNRHARQHNQHERPEGGIQKRERLGQGLNHCFGWASKALFKDGSFCAWAYACIHASKSTVAMASYPSAVKCMPSGCMRSRSIQSATRPGPPKAAVRSMYAMPRDALC